MQLNLEEPESIVQWWRACPERHWLYLEALEAQSPQFRGSIRSARRRIEADSLFSLRRVEELVGAVQSMWEQQADAADEPAVEAEFH